MKNLCLMLVVFFMVAPLSVPLLPPLSPPETGPQVVANTTHSGGESGDVLVEAIAMMPEYIGPPDHVGDGPEYIGPPERME